MRKKWVKTEATAPLDNEYKFLNAFLFFWEDASVVSSNFQFKKHPKYFNSS